MARPPILQIKREDYPAGIGSGESVDRFLRALNGFAKGISDGLTRGITYADNFAAFRKTVDVAMRDDWIAPTLQNSWLNYGAGGEAAGYRKRFGRTELRGLVKSGTINAAIFTLPAAYAPPNPWTLAVDSNTAFGDLVVANSGAVTLRTGSNVFVDLGVSFPASDPSNVPNPVFPLKLKNDLPGGARPFAVWIEHALDLSASTNGVPVSVGNPAWTSSADQIVISDIQALYANRRYRLTFLVIGG